MLVIFTVILLGLLVLGLPVAFSLGTAGLFGMFAFMGGGSSLAQIPILAYKSLDDFVLTAVPLYILMSYSFCLCNFCCDYRLVCCLRRYYWCYCHS